MSSNKNSPNRTRSGWTILVGVVVVSLLLSSCAQKPKVYRVGILSGVDAFASIADGFKAKMTELGYIEGKNIVYDFQKVNADPAGEQRIVKKFVEDKVDLIFAFPTDPALAAKAATQGTNIPVVFAMGGTEQSNLVDSVRQPGGNITGVRYPGSDIVVRRFEYLRELVPQVKRLWLTYDPDYPNNPPALTALRPIARSAGVELIEVPVKNVEGIKTDLEARVQSGDMGMDAILIMPEILCQSPEGFGVISKFAKEHKVPIAGGSVYTLVNGAVFNVIPDNVKMGRLAAPLADKIFKGTRAGTIPVITPESDMRLNYKVAQELGLKVSEGLLGQAVEVIR